MTGNSLCLDTNVAISVLNGDSSVVDWLRGFSRLYLPTPVIAELRFGALNSGHAQDNLHRVDALTARIIALDITAATAEVYARLRFALKRQGRPIPQNDLWIAALCVEHNRPLATVDAHFDAVPDLLKMQP